MSPYSGCNNLLLAVHLPCRPPFHLRLFQVRMGNNQVDDPGWKASGSGMAASRLTEGMTRRKSSTHGGGYPPSRPTMLTILVPTWRAYLSAFTIFTLICFSSSPPPTEKINMPSFTPSRFPFSQAANTTSHPRIKRRPFRPECDQGFANIANRGGV